jgi:outer membrane receptor for ferric coprogen and ferric-rhodotorulic acid
MNTFRSFAPHRYLRALIFAVFIFEVTFVVAQQVAPADTDLKKYDRNKNGRLDPDELAAMRADETKAKNAASPADPARTPDQETVQLSPFEVNAAQDKGYYASNTLSGTRLNSKIEDLASSISVVTKQQMLDNASIDINDIFLYEANTEGTGMLTAIGRPERSTMSPRGACNVCTDRCWVLAVAA